MPTAFMERIWKPKDDKQSSMRELGATNQKQQQFLRDDLVFFAILRVIAQMVPFLLQHPLRTCFELVYLTEILALDTELLKTKRSNHALISSLTVFSLGVCHWPCSFIYKESDG